MARKRRRPRQGAAGPASSSTGASLPVDRVDEGTDAETDTETSGSTAVERVRTKPADRTFRRDRPPIPGGGRLSERMRAPSPFPPLTTSLGRGFLAVCGSVPILLTTLVLTGGIWLGLVAAGLEVFPRTFVEVLAIPPVSSFYSDVLIPANIFGVALPAALMTVVLTTVRALFMGILVGMILESLEYGRVSMVGVLQGLRAFPAAMVIVGTNVLAVIASNLILPGLLGPLGFLVFTAVLAGGLYLLSFAPAAAVRGHLRGAEAMRRSARAARLPGPRHMVIFILYFFLTLLLVAVVPGGTLITANPPLSEWAWVLGGSVVHLVFLAALCDRWLVVEDQVPTGPAPRQQRARRPLFGGFNR
jgi:hypothetical protein